MIIAVIRPDIALGLLFVECLVHAICAGDEVPIWSNVYMVFSPVDGSSFEFFLLQSHSIIFQPPTPAF